MILIFYKILIATTLVGITTAIIGCFTLLNKQSLLADTIAHATLPGLAGMFLIVLEKSYVMLLIGAAITSLTSAFAVDYIITKTNLKQDTALGIILSTFFGIGIIYLTMIQKLAIGNQAGIDKFLFGQAATVLNEDIIIIITLSCLILATVIFYYKEFVIIIFDAQFARTIRLPVQRIKNILLITIVGTVLVGLQTVGLILMSSFLIAPAVAARQWTNRLPIMMLLSVFFSLSATTTGTIISYQYAHIPTGPAIVVIATLITFVSIIIRSYRDSL